MHRGTRSAKRKAAAQDATHVDAIQTAVDPSSERSQELNVHADRVANQRELARPQLLHGTDTAAAEVQQAMGERKDQKYRTYNQ